jgi:hypothetical protein
MGWIDDLIDDALMPVYDWARNIVSSVGRSIAGAFNAIGDFFKEMIMAPINGIDKMPVLSRNCPLGLQIFNPA